MDILAMYLRGIMVFAFAMLLNAQVHAEQNIENDNQTDFINKEKKTKF